MKVELVKEYEGVGSAFEVGVFGSPGYLGACSSAFGWLIADDYCLPFYVDRIKIFRRLVFTSAPLRKGDGARDLDREQEFLDAAVQVVRRAGLCDFISKPQSNAVFDVAPTGSTVCPWGTYELRIDRSDDELLKSFHQKHRNVINKALRDGVTVAPLDDLDLVYRNIRDTLLRQKLPYFPSLAFLEALKQGLPGQLLALGAFHGGELQGVALVPFDGERGYYLSGGSIERPVTGALNLLQYEVMRHLRERGVRVYDFVGARVNVEEGSKFEGIQRFKSRFGADLREGLAFRVVFSPVKFAMFHAAVSAYFLLKGWGKYSDPIDQMKVVNER